MRFPDEVFFGAGLPFILIVVVRMVVFVVATWNVIYKVGADNVCPYFMIYNLIMV